MKRTAGAAIALVVVLGAAYAATSWWMGGRVETVYHAQLAALQRQLGAGVLTEERWRRGIFRSSGALLLHVPAPSGATSEAPLEVQIEDTLVHAPLADGALAWAVQKTRVVRVQGGDPQRLQAVTLNGAAQARTVYGLRGDLRGSVTLPGGKLTATQRPAQWSALQLQWRAPAASAGRVTGAVQWPGARWQVLAGRADSPATRRQAALEGVQADFEVDARSGLWLLPPGRIDAQATHFSVRAGDLDNTTSGDAPAAAANDKPLLQLNDLQLHGKTQLAEGLLQDDSEWTASGSLAGAPLTQLRARTHFARLDAAALLQLQPELVRLLRQRQGAGLVADWRVLEPALRRLSDAGPQGAVTLEATLAGQAATQQASASFEPTAALKGLLLRHLPWQLQLIPRARAEVALRLPQAWLPPLAAALHDPEISAETLDAALRQLAQRDLLVRADDAWTFSASYADGHPLLNGQPLWNGLLGALAQLGGLGR